MSTTDMTNGGQGPSPPTPHSLGRLSQSTLSMRNKKQLKRHANAHHSSNFHAGYVPVTEEVLHRSGIRGRKRYFLYCSIGVLLFVALVNMLVTVCLVYLLRMTHDGVAHLETVDVNAISFLRIFGTTFASSFIFNGVPLGAKHGSILSVTSQGSPMNINSFVSSRFSPKLSFNESSVSVLADLMLIKSNGSDVGTSLDIQTVAKTNGISNYLVGGLITKKIQNHKQANDLYLESPVKEIHVSGSQGVDMKSMKDLEVTARNIFVETDNSVVLQSKRSVYLDPSLSISSSRSKGSKICVCGNGKLFFVDATSKTACAIEGDEFIDVCTGPEY